MQKYRITCLYHATYYSMTGVAAVRNQLFHLENIENYIIINVLNLASRLGGA